MQQVTQVVEFKFLSASLFSVELTCLPGRRPDYNILRCVHQVHPLMRQAHYMIIVEHDCVLYLCYLNNNASARKKLLTVRRLSSQRRAWCSLSDEILIQAQTPDTNFACREL